MFTYEITFLPASLPSLTDSYRRVRMAVGWAQELTRSSIVHTNPERLFKEASCLMP